MWAAHITTPMGFNAVLDDSSSYHQIENIKKFQNLKTEPRKMVES